MLTSRANHIYGLMDQFGQDVVKTSTQPEPIRFELNSFGDFFSNFFDNFLIYPVGLLLMFFSKIFGGKYILGLLITTIIIRTLGWPIYTKTNDMSLKMKLMEPEQAKIQEKYARRKDEESQRMMQMEMMQLYKKYNNATIKQRLQLTYFTKEKETHWGSFQNAICKHLRTQQSWF